ncbi:hypothetical protein KQX54_019674 [Cotesia glomerata]|uniref:Uncharacterized protein n=1 Tax=Cotesia glomerata TaxID=32391 RepID=A0AAV7HZ42_COTGL|nr:hypothetical protein KQX54_019674 [Cotesia glomerata]
MRKVKNVNVNGEEAPGTTKTTTTTTIFLMRGGRNNNVGCLGGEVLQRSCLQDNRRGTFSSLLFSFWFLQLPPASRGSYYVLCAMCYYRLAVLLQPWRLSRYRKAGYATRLSCLLGIQAKVVKENGEDRTPDRLV